MTLPATPPDLARAFIMRMIAETPDVETTIASLATLLAAVRAEAVREYQEANAHPDPVTPPRRSTP